MKATLALLFFLAAQTCSPTGGSTISASLLGRWRVDFSFADKAPHSLRLEARPDGKAFVTLLDARSNMTEAAEPSKAKWEQSSGNHVSFSGPIEFPIGNVGRDQGTLVCKGKFETEDSIVGDVFFFPLGQDPDEPKTEPSKTGTFKGTRSSEH